MADYASLIRQSPANREQANEPNLPPEVISKGVGGGREEPVTLFVGSLRRTEFSSRSAISASNRSFSDSSATVVPPGGFGLR